MKYFVTQLSGRTELRTPLYSEPLGSAVSPLIILVGFDSAAQRKETVFHALEVGSLPIGVRRLGEIQLDFW